MIPQAEDFREQDLETIGGLSQASQFLCFHSLQSAITACNPDTPVHSEEQPFESQRPTHGWSPRLLVYLTCEATPELHVGCDGETLSGCTATGAGVKPCWERGWQ